MGRIVIELTNRCNLRCGHCLEGRHGGHGDLPLTILDEILEHAREFGFKELSFTGGEPTLHKRFFEVVEKTVDAGYSFGFVSNGWNFPRIYQRLLPFRAGLTTITFSMDGAREATHDGLRGAGSYRRLLQAMSVCAIKKIPFTINMVVTRDNHTELEQQVELAARLGSRGLRFGHLMPTSDSDRLALSIEEKHAVEARIHTLGQTAVIPVAMAPGYHTPDLFPCAPLQNQEFNVDWRGNVTLCCHLSGYEVAPGDVAGYLQDISFGEALARLEAVTQRYRGDKQHRQAAGQLQHEDYFPCLYCCRYFDKPGGADTVPVTMLPRSSVR